MPTPSMNDFIQYWTAYGVVNAGGNPYDPAQLLEAQQKIRPMSEPLMMWTPPWTSLVLEPVLQFDYETSKAIFFGLNLVVVGLIALLLSELFKHSRAQTVTFFLLSFFFPPIVSTLQLGQISIFLMAALVLGLWLHERKSYVMSGMIYSLCTIKPHLFLIFGLGLLWFSFKHRNLKILCGGLLGTLLLAALTELRFPGAISLWLDVHSNAGEVTGVIRTVDWVGATFSSFSKLLPGPVANTFGNGTPWVVCGCFAVGTLATLIRRQPRKSLTELAPFLLLVSYIGAPFGWFFDQAILLPVVAFLLFKVTDAQRLHSRATVLLFLLFVAVNIFVARAVTFHHELVWFPFVLAILLLLVSIRSEPSRQSLETIQI